MDNVDQSSNNDAKKNSANNSSTKKSQVKSKGPFTLGKTLGEGAFAKVKLATHIVTNEKLAIKIIDKSKLIKDENDISRVKREINILKKIRHKNIIQLYEVMESKNNLYIVMELCEGKDLFEYIIKKGKLKEKEACHFFQQIINGVDYLHQQGIIHRDLKPENLLLDINNNIKISDFGLSTFFTHGRLLETPCGTPSYAPPEMLRGDDYNGELSDVYSCGVILYAMLCGRLPYSESKEDILLKKIMNHEYVVPSFVSKSACSLIHAMLSIDPKKRITIPEIIRHPWFNIVEPKMCPGLSLDTQKPPVDEEIINQMIKYGYDVNQCREAIMNNHYVTLTAVYYLLLKKHILNGGTSVSDLESKEYLNYLKTISPAKKNCKSFAGGTVKKIIHIEKHQKKKSIDITSIQPSKLKLSYQSLETHRTPSPSNSKSPPGKKKGAKFKGEVSSFSPIGPSNNKISKQTHLEKQMLYKKKRQERTKIRQRGPPTTAKSLTQIQMIENEDLKFEEDLKKIDSLGSVNIIQYIAKKLIGNSFCESFDISINSSKKNNTLFSTKNSSCTPSKKSSSNKNNFPKLKNAMHSFVKKKEVFIYNAPEKYKINKKLVGNHVNKFLDISTNQIESSIERSVSQQPSSPQLSPEVRQSPSENVDTKTSLFHLTSNQKKKSSSKGKLVSKSNIINEEEDDEDIKDISTIANKNTTSTTKKNQKKNYSKNKLKKFTINLLKTTTKSNNNKFHTISTASTKQSNGSKRSDVMSARTKKVRTKNATSSFEYSLVSKYRHNRTGSANESLLNYKKVFNSNLLGEQKSTKHKLEIDLNTINFDSALETVIISQSKRYQIKSNKNTFGINK